MGIRIRTVEITAEFPLRLRQESGTFSLGISNEVYEREGSRLPDYTGSYEVVPDVGEKVIPTKEKSLHEDITVKKIPTFETSNEHGTTFIIAS